MQETTQLTDQLGELSEVDQATSSAPVCVISNDKGYLTKVFSRDAAGHIQKTAAATLSRGKFKVLTVRTLAELNAVLEQLGPKQAVTYGRPEAESGIVAARAIAEEIGAIARTREHFSFHAGPGILMLDSDPAPGQQHYVKDELVAILKQACPFLEGVEMLWRPSSSSGVDGDSIRGQRIYIIVDNATEIPRIGKAIFDRLWLAGFGRFEISKSGQLLPRAPIDAVVFQPERLDFAARPVLSDGITQVKYESALYPGSMLRAKEATSLNETETIRLGILKSQLRRTLKDKVEEVQHEYIEAQALAMSERLRLEDVSENLKTAAERAVRQHLLTGEWSLITSKDESVTVAEVLDNPRKWHKTRFADPLEPDDDLRVAWANLMSGGRPYLYSHKHGGVRFILERAPAILKIQPGELPEQVDALVQIFQKDGDLFERAGSVVHVDHNQRIVQAKQPWLAVRAQRSVRFERFDKKEGAWLPTRCPTEVTSGILTFASRYRLPALSAVRDAATMDLSGRIVDAPGFDEATGILIICNDPNAWPPIVRAPNRAQLRVAFQKLWTPFAEFPYSSPADASAALAAVLTTAVRAILPTAPAFGFSATAPGTGKTLLAQSIGSLYSGVEPAVNAPITQEDEWRKALFAAALGGAMTYLLDNAEHSIESSSLAAAITAGKIADRVLGESRNEAVDHRMMIMATGNGLRLIGDLNRRFFVSRLDAHIEASHIVSRKFDLNPLEYCKNHRVEMNAAALTLMRGYAAAGFPRVCDGLASFDDWNKLVRSTIIWLINEGIAEGYVDPVEALQRETSNDPDTELLMALMQVVEAGRGISQRFTVRDLIYEGNNGNDLEFILLEIAGDSGRINSKRLGHWLNAREGRIVNGMSLVKDGKHRTGIVQWKIKKV